MKGYRRRPPATAARPLDSPLRRAGRRRRRPPRRRRRRPLGCALPRRTRKALSWRRKAVETQANGSVLAKKGYLPPRVTADPRAVRPTALFAAAEARPS